MRIVPFRSVIRPLGIMTLAAVPLLGVIDTGAVGYARLATDDDAATVARAAAEAVRGLALSQQTAQIAYQAADSTARRFGATVARKDFAVHRDGRVTLTLERTAPTLLIGHLPFLCDLTDISTTVTVEPSPYA